MPPRPPDPHVFHPLPAAPVFLGREAELAQLRAFWDNGGRGVLSLVGLGGAGKQVAPQRQLISAESARRQADMASCQENVQSASAWILDSEPGPRRAAALLTWIPVSKQMLRMPLTYLSIELQF